MDLYTMRAEGKCSDLHVVTEAEWSDSPNEFGCASLHIVDTAPAKCWFDPKDVRVVGGGPVGGSCYDLIPF